MTNNEGSSGQVNRTSWQSWEEELKAIGVTNPLMTFETNTFGQIDLERSHPGGFSQFVTGRQTLLSNLVRDPLAFSRALSAARRIKAKADRISSNFGLDTLYLVGGLANFEADGFDLNVPILMWPLDLLKKGEDYELSLAGPPQVNPILVESLEVAYGINLNQSELLARQNESSDLVPLTVLNYLANLTADKANLDLKRILVIGNFTAVSQTLLRDLTHTSNGLLDALTGEPTDGLGEIDIPELNLVVDADATQMRVVARALAGQSFAVETLPGCGYTQTVVNVLAALAENGKRTLVVAPRRQTLNELADRLSAVGLGGLGIRADSTWVDIIAAISRNEKASAVDAEAARAKRIAAEDSLDEYFKTLNDVDEVLGVSLARVLRELSRLSGLPHAPLTSARIEEQYLLQHLDKSAAIDLLTEAFELGEFKFGPQDTAWFQAKFSNPAEVEQAVELAKHLRDEAYPKLANQLAEFTEKVNFKAANSVDEWSKYLRLFVGIRETLDRFLPAVFDRPITELVAATAPRKGVDKSERSQMSGGNRRRLKKLAKEYLRTGMHVADMHVALKAIQEQRELWLEFSTMPTAPQVPTGIHDAQIALQAFVADLEKLQSHMDDAPGQQSLTEMTLFELQQKLTSLAEDTDALEKLGERSMVSGRLAAVGLGPLSRDLARLHTSREHLAAELDQAWWQSALEVLITRDNSILNFSSEQLAQNEENFKIAFDEQIEVGARIVAQALSKRWNEALAANKSEATALKQLLKSGATNFALTQAAAPKIWPALAPALLLSPYELPAFIGKEQAFDAVLVLDAAGSTIAENLGAISRSKQIIAFGDDAIAAPVGFEIECRAIPLGRELSVASVFAEVRRIFGSEVLRRSYRTTGQSLGELINREFYQNRIQYAPSAAEYFGERNFILDQVTEGNRAKTTIEGATESLDAELARTVDLVYNHALWHPDQSLLVSSASTVHAERIRAAVIAGLRDKPNLAEFFDSHGREKFEVAPLADLGHRIADRVIFSLGYGRTSHGAVLSSFGQMSDVDGRRYLANLLVSARKQITVVSCFGPDEVPTDRMANGAALLKDLLQAASAEREPVANPVDPMLQDLSLRLKKLGARVDTGFSQETPLVVAYAKSAAVIEADWSIPGENRTEKFHIRPGLLTALGWKYIRVYSFELFSNPQALAIRIAEQLGMQVTKRSVPLFDDSDRAFEDTDAAWGDRVDSNDQRLKQDKPPHWG